jgi:hypothetical protein
MKQTNTSAPIVKYRVKLEGEKSNLKEGFTDLKDVIAFVEELKKNSKDYVIETYLDNSEPELLLENNDKPT